MRRIFLGLLLCVGITAVAREAYTQVQQASPTAGSATGGVVRLPVVDEGDARSQVVQTAAMQPPAGSPPPAGRQSSPPPPRDSAPNGSTLNVKPRVNGNAAPATNDPTVPGPAIRDLLNNTPKEAGSVAQSALPNMTLKALIAFKNKPAIAVIEIGGRSVTIREGNEFTVPADGELVPVRVATLSATAVQLELVNRRAMVNLK